MKIILLALLLILACGFALITVLSTSPRKMILGWLATGFFQTLFFLVIGFELLALLNVFLTLGAATVLKLYSALFGFDQTKKSESVLKTKDWIYGLGQTATLGAVLVFALSETLPTDRLHEDLVASAFSNNLMERFPELPWILGFVLFLFIIVGATVGRPAWKKLQGEQS